MSAAFTAEITQPHQHHFISAFTKHRRIQAILDVITWPRIRRHQHGAGLAGTSRRRSEILTPVGFGLFVSLH
jgi:hypothetical protein